MHTGNPVARHWLLILRDGAAIVDWGDQRYQDVATGNFLELDDTQVSHAANNQDLDQLRHAGMISGYDEQNVYLLGLPELPHKDLG
jgi:hypothetical protein